MQCEYNNRDMQFFKAIDTSDRTKILGYAKWVIEGGIPTRGTGNNKQPTDGDSKSNGGVHKRTAMPSPFRPPNVATGDSNGKLFRDWLPELIRKRHQYIDGTKTVALDDLWVVPDHQRQGIGTMLLEAFVRFADERGLPCYLESTPVAFDMYLFHGFRKVDELVIDLAKWREGFGMYKSAMLYRDARRALDQMAHVTKSVSRCLSRRRSINLNSGYNSISMERIQVRIADG